jgi:hypothetical protein
MGSWTSLVALSLSLSEKRKVGGSTPPLPVSDDQVNRDGLIKLGEGPRAGDAADVTGTVRLRGGQNLTDRRRP